MKKDRYDSINGLRAIMCVGILVMHVYANGGNVFNGYIFDSLIPSFNSFVFLFMMISGFGMCCGYYDKIKNNKISMNDFYKKRYKKIFPFFAILVLFDVLIERSVSSLIEGFADLTLVYGFLPNQSLQVIGVGWTIGVIFAFYILFPFFVFLLDNKKRACFSLIITLVLNLLCVCYFFDTNFVIDNFRASGNILYCAVYFMLGGIIYLYKNELVNLLKNKYIYIGCLIISMMLFLLPLDTDKYEWFYTVKNCFVYSLWLIIAISSVGKIMDNKITKYLSDISMEIYLSHMVIFRVIERVGLINIFGNNIISYFANCILVLIGAVIFSKVVDKIIMIISNKLYKR